MKDLKTHINEAKNVGNMDVDNDGIEDSDYEMMMENMGMYEGMEKCNKAYKGGDMMERKMMEAGMKRMMKENIDKMYEMKKMKK